MAAAGGLEHDRLALESIRGGYAWTSAESAGGPRAKPAAIDTMS